MSGIEVTPKGPLPDYLLELLAAWSPEFFVTSFMLVAEVMDADGHSNFMVTQSRNTSPANLVGLAALAVETYKAPLRGYGERAQRRPEGTDGES